MTPFRTSAAVAMTGLALAMTAVAQTPQQPTSEQRVLALAKELQEQQTQIAANQEKIEAKLVAVAEAVRQAKIYSSRGGR